MDSFSKEALDAPHQQPPTGRHPITPVPAGQSVLVCNACVMPQKRGRGSGVLLPRLEIGQTIAAFCSADDRSPFAHCLAHPPCPNRTIRTPGSGSPPDSRGRLPEGWPCPSVQRAAQCAAGSAPSSVATGGTGYSLGADISYDFLTHVYWYWLPLRPVRRGRPPHLH